ncbi:MAG TPA: hypothetical protein VGH53_18065 [Streptosporangiaceae bacterium]|jgi:hypothetical protein
MNPLAGVLGESWQLYRTYARHLLTIAVIVYVIAAIVSAVLELTGGIFGALLGFLVTIVAAFLLTAALVKAVQDVRDGTVNLSVGQTLSAATPFIGPVAIAAILAGIAVAIGLFILIIPGLFLLTVWCLIVPVIVLEGTGPFDSFGRSWQLVKGHFWNVFGILFMVFLILFVVDVVLGLVFSALPLFLAHFLSSVVGGTLIAPFIAVVTTLMYFRLSAVAVGTGSASGQYGGSDPYGNPGQYGSSGPFTS